MKAKLLKDIKLAHLNQISKKGEIVAVRVPEGSNKAYIRSGSNETEIELTIGTDVELIREVKARLLKDFGTKGTIGGFIGSKGDIIDVQVRDGGNKVYTFNSSTGKNDREFIIGTDVELVTDKGITKEKLGSYMFVGGILLLTYIAYKLIKEK
jgi:hypothetical protein